MTFYINSEKYLSNAEELSFNELLRMSGYPLNKSYIIINEKSGKRLNPDDSIIIENNMSLMIHCI